MYITLMILRLRDYLIIRMEVFFGLIQSHFLQNAEAIFANLVLRQCLFCIVEAGNSNPLSLVINPVAAMNPCDADQCVSTNCVLCNI